MVEATGCAPGAGPSPSHGSWKLSGRGGVIVNSLSRFQGTIYAATNQGIYKTTIGDQHWNAAGLRQDTIRKVVFLPGNKLLAAIRISDCCGGIPSLFLSTNEGKSWQPYMNDFGGPAGKYTWVQSMTEISRPSDTLYIQASGGVISRSIDGGKHWEIVHGAWNNWGGFGMCIVIDQYSNGTIWAGGSDIFLQTSLIKSSDYGGTWKDKSKGIGGEVEDVILNPHHSNHVLAGLLGGVAKSTNGGNSWQFTSANFSAYCFTYSARNPNVIYASGKNTDGTLFFAASRDFGDTWQSITMPDSPTGIQVNDMVSVMQSGHEVLYFGTNQGVYSYRFGE